MPTRRLLIRTTAAALVSLPWRSSSAEQAAKRAAPQPTWTDPASGYKLVKNWDFVSTIRDTNALQKEFYTRYIYGNGSTDHLNDEWTRYRDKRNHVFTSEGLSLVARVVGDLSPGNIESGMLRSRWSGQYGAFEIRMRVPTALGTLPAFWLNPQDQKWPPEIDVVEIVNNGYHTTHNSFHFLHGAGPGKSGQLTQGKLDDQHAYTPGVDYSRGFHTFSAEWDKDSVRHYVDRVLVAERTYQWLHADGSDGGPAHVLVNLAVGGKWPGPPSSAKAFPASLVISYIRVWQRQD